jgi:hypothetical protein
MMIVVVSEGVVLVIDIIAISKCDGGVLFVVARRVLDAVRPQDGKEHGPPIGRRAQPVAASGSHSGRHCPA